MEYHDLRPILEKDQCALAAYSNYWFKKMNGAATGADHKKLAEVAATQARVQSYIEQHIDPEIIKGTKFGVADAFNSFFSKVNFHYEENGNTNFTDLNFLGLHAQGAESVWEELTWLASHYRKLQASGSLDKEQIRDVVDQRKKSRQAIVSTLDKQAKGFYSQNHTAVNTATVEFYKNRPLSVSADESERLQSALDYLKEKALEEAIGIPSEHLPIPYSLFEDPELQGAIPPQFSRLVDFNRAIMDGKTIYLYCCPNYETVQRDDGVREYTFGSLGTNIGLTAERGFPFINRLLANASALRQKGILPHPISIRVAIADYEATDDNADLVGLTTDQFQQRLGKSVENMRDTLATRIHTSVNHGAFYQIERTNDDHESIGEWKIDVQDANTYIGHIRLGSITRNHHSDTPFHERVAAKRQVLETRAQEDPEFQNQLDGLLKLRLGLMLRWRDGNEPTTVTDLGEIFDQISQSGHTSVVAQEYRPLVEELSEVYCKDEFTPGEKNIIYKAVLVNWMRKHSDIPGVSEAIAYLRRKIASQGAEYAVMTESKMENGGGAQIVADSAHMWEVFGNKAIPVIAFKGGYEGAN